MYFLWRHQFVWWTVNVKNTHLAVQKCIICQVATIGSILKFESKWLMSGQTPCIASILNLCCISGGFLSVLWDKLYGRGSIHRYKGWQTTYYRFTCYKSISKREPKIQGPTYRRVFGWSLRGLLEVPVPNKIKGQAHPVQEKTTLWVHPWEK